MAHNERHAARSTLSGAAEAPVTSGWPDPVPSRDRSRWSRLRHWSSQGVYAVLDKALFALANFLLNVLLVRWLTAAEYGAFAVILTVFYLFATLHTGLLSEPVLVFGPGRWEERLRAYLFVVLRDHWWFAAGAFLLFVVVGLGAYAWGSKELAAASLGMAVAAPFILFQWLGRVACFAELRPADAARAGAIYMAVVLSSAWILHRSDMLGSASALGVMGGASLVSGLWLLRILRPERPAGDVAAFRTEVRRAHGSYGGWAAATGFLAWLPSEVYYVVIPLWFGLEAAGVLRAMMNLIMPVVMTFSALGVLLTSQLVRSRGTTAFSRLWKAGIAASLVAAGVYYAFLFFFGGELLSVVYDGGYERYAGLFRILGLIPVVGGPGVVLTAALRARERPDRVFHAYVASGAIALTGGMALTFRYGLEGAAVTLVVSGAVATAFLVRPILAPDPDPQSRP